MPRLLVRQIITAAPNTEPAPASANTGGKSGTIGGLATGAFIPIVIFGVLAALFFLVLIYKIHLRRKRRWTAYHAHISGAVVPSDPVSVPIASTTTNSAPSLPALNRMSSIQDPDDRFSLADDKDEEEALKTGTPKTPHVAALNQPVTAPVSQATLTSLVPSLPATVDPNLALKTLGGKTVHLSDLVREREQMKADQERWSKVAFSDPSRPKPKHTHTHAHSDIPASPANHTASTPTNPEPETAVVQMTTKERRRRTISTSIEPSSMDLQSVSSPVISITIDVPTSSLPATPRNRRSYVAPTSSSVHPSVTDINQRASMAVGPTFNPFVESPLITSQTPQTPIAHINTAKIQHLAQKAEKKANKEAKEAERQRRREEREEARKQKEQALLMKKLAKAKTPREVLGNGRKVRSLSSLASSARRRRRQKTATSGIQEETHEDAEYDDVDQEPDSKRAAKTNTQTSSNAAAIDALDYLPVSPKIKERRTREKRVVSKEKDKGKKDDSSPTSDKTTRSKDRKHAPSPLRTSAIDREHKSSPRLSLAGLPSPLAVNIDQVMSPYASESKRISMTISSDILKDTQQLPASVLERMGPKARVRPRSIIAPAAKPSPTTALPAPPSATNGAASVDQSVGLEDFASNSPVVSVRHSATIETPLIASPLVGQGTRPAMIRAQSHESSRSPRVSKVSEKIAKGPDPNTWTARGPVPPRKDKSTSNKITPQWWE